MYQGILYSLVSIIVVKFCFQNCKQLETGDRFKRGLGGGLHSARGLQQTADSSALLRQGCSSVLASTQTDASLNLKEISHSNYV